MQHAINLLRICISMYQIIAWLITFIGRLMHLIV